MKSEIRVDGMHCDSCVRRVTLAVKKIPAAKLLSARIGAVEVDVADDTERSAVVAEIRKMGFEVDR